MTVQTLLTNPDVVYQMITSDVPSDRMEQHLERIITTYKPNTDNVEEVCKAIERDRLTPVHPSETGVTDDIIKISRKAAYTRTLVESGINNAEAQEVLWYLRDRLPNEMYSIDRCTDEIMVALRKDRIISELVDKFISACNTAAKFQVYLGLALYCTDSVHSVNLLGNRLYGVMHPSTNNSGSTIEPFV